VAVGAHRQDVARPPTRRKARQFVTPLGSFVRVKAQLSKPLP
jgi:hypothetical protein